METEPKTSTGKHRLDTWALMCLFSAISLAAYKTDEEYDEEGLEEICERIENATYYDHYGQDAS